MNWLAFLRWLARAEITKAYEAGFSQAQCASDMRSAMAYETGRLDGARQAFDAMDQQANERFDVTGEGENIQPKDVAKAKKGFVH